LYYVIVAVVVVVAVATTLEPLLGACGFLGFSVGFVVSWFVRGRLAGWFLARKRRSLVKKREEVARLEREVLGK
jgi:membrane protein DedA with SNARE-associated domain